MREKLGGGRWVSGRCWSGGSEWERDGCGGGGVLRRFRSGHLRGRVP